MDIEQAGFVLVLLYGAVIWHVIAEQTTRWLHIFPFAIFLLVAANTRPF